MHLVNDLFASFSALLSSSPPSPDNMLAPSLLSSIVITFSRVSSKAFVPSPSSIPFSFLDASTSMSKISACSFFSIY
jgi:hypothetical protein